MDRNKILVERNRDHWIRIIERNIQDLSVRVNIQHSMLLTILGKIKSDRPDLGNQTSFEPCSMADCPHKKLFQFEQASGGKGNINYFYLQGNFEF